MYIHMTALRCILLYRDEYTTQVFSAVNTHLYSGVTKALWDFPYCTLVLLVIFRKKSRLLLLQSQKLPR